MSIEYRIKRRAQGDYEVHRKVGFFWKHDGGNRRLKSQTKSTYFKLWYDTYEQAKLGVAARIDFNRRADEEGGTLGAKLIYQPFPDSDI